MRTKLNCTKKFRVRPGEKETRERKKVQKQVRKEVLTRDRKRKTTEDSRGGGK